MKQVRSGFAVLAVLALSSACATAGAPAAGGVTDGEAVAMLVAANEGEVVTNQPAVQASSSAAVREFAQRMVTEHTAALQRLQGLNIPPAPNDYTRRLQENAQQTARNVATYSGAARDRVHMDSQIALHEYTLRLLDFLEPRTRDGRLRAMIPEMRTAVTSHLAQARQIRSGL